MAFIVTLLAGLYPAMLAARMEPVEALRGRRSDSRRLDMEVTKVENVTRIFKIGKVETQALRGVSLSIESGEFTALVGPSGSGKTTLLQLIGCLDQPTSGQVFINGKDVSQAQPQPARRYAPRHDRLYLPVLCPDPDPDRLREHRDAAAAERAQRSPSAGRASRSCWRQSS